MCIVNKQPKTEMIQKVNVTITIPTPLPLPANHCQDFDECPSSLVVYKLCNLLNFISQHLLDVFPYKNKIHPIPFNCVGLHRSVPFGPSSPLPRACSAPKNWPELEPLKSVSTVWMVALGRPWGQGPLLTRHGRHPLLLGPLGLCTQSSLSFAVFSCIYRGKNWFLLCLKKRQTCVES